MSLVSSTSQNYILGAGQGTLQPGLMAINLGNPDIKWQDNSMANIGVDLGLFDNKLSVTAEYFRSESGGLLVRVPLVPSVGSAASPYVNAGSILNQGFEFSAKHTYTRGDLVLGTGFNLATLKNKVLELGGRNEDIISGAARPRREALGLYLVTCGSSRTKAGRATRRPAAPPSCSRPPTRRPVSHTWQTALSARPTI
jgi:outer membrane receptor protein involved in Fe transport